MLTKAELDLHKDIAGYLRLQYKSVLFRFDMAGVNLDSHRARNLFAALNYRGWPDLFIAAAKKDLYKGCFLELKADGVRLYLKDGTTLRKNEHVAEQRAVLDNLYQQGFFAQFATGFDEAKRLIDWYLKPEREFLQEHGYKNMWKKTTTKEEF